MKFLWEGVEEKRKLHLMKKSEVVKLDQEEELGQGLLINKNWGLLSKSKQRFEEERSSLEESHTV